MATPNRRLFLSAAGAASLAAVLAACADTGADGQAVSSSSAGSVDYNTVINSGPVAADDAVAAPPSNLRPTIAALYPLSSLQSGTRPPKPGQAHACSQILTFRPLPMKPHEKIIGKGRFCL